MTPNYEQFFANYVQTYNDALRGHMDTDRIRRFFSDKFLAAGPRKVTTASNGMWFKIALKRAYAFYKKIGTKKLHLMNVTVTKIDDHHDMTKVVYQSEYRKPDGKQIFLCFEVTYLFQHYTQNPEIFAFIADDEMEVYRSAGLI